MEKIICYTAGRAQGNPGPAEIAVCIIDKQGQGGVAVKRSIGNASSDFAAYNAVMVGLQTLLEKYGTQALITHFEIHLDNEPVKKQLNNEDQINDPGLVPMFIEIHNMRVVSFPNLTFLLTPADKNPAVVQVLNKVVDEG